MISGLSDEQLVTGAAHGDQEYWTVLYRRHQGRIYRFAFHMSGSHSIAEEATQETFLALLRRMGGYSPAKGTVAAYLLGIARFKVLRLLEQEPGHEEMPAVDPATPANPEEDLARGFQQEQLRRAIVALPDVYREALVLCELDGIDYAEAAAALGCPIGTIKSRVSRAKQMLLDRLARAGTPQKGCLA